MLSASWGPFGPRSLHGTPVHEYHFEGHSVIQGTGIVGDYKN